MIQETIHLRADDGNQTEATARVERYPESSRKLKGMIWIVGGIIAGLATLPIFVLHLLTVWGLPLIGIVIGLKTMRTPARVHEIDGTCPACNEPIQIWGGPLQDIGWHTCPRCHARVMPCPEGLADDVVAMHSA